jgi:hypothetical protein
MNLYYYMSAAFITFLPSILWADVGKVVEPLPCGIYNHSVKPFVQKNLETQHEDQARYTMGMTTRSGKNLSVEIKNVSIEMFGERNRVTVLLDGKPFARTSHQDVPLYVEVHIDDEKYRIICVRVQDSELGISSSAGLQSRPSISAPSP